MPPTRPNPISTTSAEAALAGSRPRVLQRILTPTDMIWRNDAGQLTSRSLIA